MTSLHRSKQGRVMEPDRYMDHSRVDRAKYGRAKGGGGGGLLRALTKQQKLQTKEAEEEDKAAEATDASVEPNVLWG